MVNTQVLVNFIKKSGFKKGYIAQRMGGSRRGLNMKLKTGRFTTREASILCNILEIKDPSEKVEIFSRAM